MEPCYLLACFFLVLASLFLFGMLSLCSGKLLFITNRVFGVRDARTWRKHHKRFQANIHTYMLLSWLQGLHIFFHQDRNEVPASLIFRDGHTGWFCILWQFTRPYHRQWFFLLCQ